MRFIDCDLGPLICWGRRPRTWVGGDWGSSSSGSGSGFMHLYAPALRVWGNVSRRRGRPSIEASNSPRGRAAQGHSDFTDGAAQRRSRRGRRRGGQAQAEWKRQTRGKGASLRSIGQQQQRRLPPTTLAPSLPTHRGISIQCERGTWERTGKGVSACSCMHWIDGPASPCPTGEGSRGSPMPTHIQGLPAVTIAEGTTPLEDSGGMNPRRSTPPGVPAGRIQVSRAETLCSR